MEVTLRPPRAAIAAALLLGLAACAGSGTAGTSASRPLPVVRAGDLQDGKTVTLRRGQRLSVVLHSTYWQFQGSSRPTVLRPRGAPVTDPRPAGCVPGQGCGTVTEVFLAAAVGSADVTAARTSCGEAMGCTAATGRYVLHVRVRR